MNAVDPFDNIEHECVEFVGVNVAKRRFFEKYPQLASLKMNIKHVGPIISWTTKNSNQKFNEEYKFIRNLFYPTTWSKCIKI